MGGSFHSQFSVNQHLSNLDDQEVRHGQAQVQNYSASVGVSSSARMVRTMTMINSKIATLNA